MDDILTTLKNQFQPYELPPQLISLLEYQDKSPTFFAGSFEVEPDEYGALDKIVPSAERRSALRVFGMDGVMSLYALWFYPGRTATTAPVVYLSGEGAGNLVLASDFSAFLTILATNQDYEPFDHEFIEADPDTVSASKKFRRWLESQFGLRAAADPLAVVEASAKAHPDFGAWLAGKIK